MDYRLVGVVMVLVLMISGTFAYSGFSGYNRYYYTDNYVPTVYYAAPTYAYAAPAYVYTPTYYRSYYPTYVVTNYVAPVTYYNAPVTRSYSNFSIYSDGDAWGVSFGRGTVCGYYGYC